MARQPVRITDLSTDTAEVTDVVPTSTAMGLVVRVAGTVPGTTTALDSEHAEDSGHVSGDIGVFMLAVQSSTVGSLVNANFDYAPLQVDSSGHLRTTLPDALMIQEPVLVQQDPSTWSSVASATNAVATATKAASTGVRHFVTSIAGSFDKPPTVARRLDLRDGVTNVFSAFIADPFVHNFGSPIKMSVNTAANLVLAAGGTGAIGLVSMAGYTT